MIARNKTGRRQPCAQNSQTQAILGRIQVRNPGPYRAIPHDWAFWSKYEMDRNTRTDIERTIGGKVGACLARIPHKWLRNSNPVQHLDHVEYPVKRGANLCLALEIPAPSDHGGSPVGGREAPQPGQQTGRPAWFRTPA